MLQRKREAKNPKNMGRKKSPNDSSPQTVPTSRRQPMREFSRSLPMSLLRAREAVMRQFRPSLRSHGLTEQQWRILRALLAIDTSDCPSAARWAALRETAVAGFTGLARLYICC